jgi:hypothetical protein
MKGSFTPYIIGAVLGAVLLFGYYYFDANRASAELEVLKSQNEAKRKKIDDLTLALETKDELYRQQIRLRIEDSEALEKKKRVIRKQIAEIKRLRTVELLEISDLPIADIAKRTSEIIKLEPPHIDINPAGNLELDEEAAKANLLLLVDGVFVAQDLERVRELLRSTEGVVQNLQRVVDLQKELISNLEKEKDLVSERSELKIGELEKEISVLKKRARKRNVVAAFIGLVAGLFLGR